MNGFVSGRQYGRLARWCRRSRAALALAVVILLLGTGTALAAEIAGGETYILPRGQVISDDLYVTAREVIIEGTVEGDLVVAGGYIEVSGVVMGDLLAAGAGVVVSGAVQDDARLAGSGVLITGNIGDDLFAAGGGWPGSQFMPMPVAGRSVAQGVQVANSATIGGDSYLAGGVGTVAGSIGGDLGAAMGALTFSGRVMGNADLASDQLTINEAARVNGTLTVTSDEPTEVPEPVAVTVRREVEDTQQRTGANLLWDVVWWLLRTALIVVGLAVLGWLLWSLAPQQIRGPVQTLERQPVESGIYGLLAAVAVIPVSAALVFLAVLIWGWFPGGVVMLAFAFGVSALVWLISPLVTGLWLGRRVTAAAGWAQADLPALLLGVALIVVAARLLAQVPCVGALLAIAIYLLSFALAVGSWILARRRPTGSVVVQPA